MFKEAYTAAMRFYKTGPWYINADIWGGLPTQRQFTSLQAFWPGTSHCKQHVHNRSVCGRHMASRRHSNRHKTATCKGGIFQIEKGRSCPLQGASALPGPLRARHTFPVGIL